MVDTIAYVRCAVWQVSCGKDGSSSGGGGFLTPLTAVGDTLGKGVSEPPLLMGDRFALAAQILVLTDE